MSDPDPDAAALEAVLDELDAAEARVRQAALVAAELEEALDGLEAAEARLDELRRKRAEAEAALGRPGVLRVHARRVRG